MEENIDLERCPTNVIALEADGVHLALDALEQIRQLRERGSSAVEVRFSLAAMRRFLHSAGITDDDIGEKGIGNTITGMRLFGLPVVLAREYMERDELVVFATNNLGPIAKGNG